MLTQDYTARRPIMMQPLTPAALLARVRSLTGNKTLQLWKPSSTGYAVTVTSEGEQILLTYSKDDSPEPVLSILPNGIVYAWGPYVMRAQNKLLLSELFVRQPYSPPGVATPKFSLDVHNMYVRRLARNSDGFAEPVLVPWLAHVASEHGTNIVYRLGNSILDAYTGKPVLEFRRLGEGPAWAVIGAYKDQDIEGGSVFWLDIKGDYLSLTPGHTSGVRWRRQDRDSLDRIGAVVLAKKDIPSEVLNYMDSLPKASNPRHPANLRPAGFDWLEGDNGVIQLERNDITFATTGTSASLALAGAPGLGEKTRFTATELGPRLGLRTLSQWWSGEQTTKPIQITQAGSGNNTFNAATYTDQTGTQSSGIVLASRNGTDSGKIYSVLNRSTNQVQDVSSDGHTLGSPITVEQYSQRANGTIQRMEQMRDSGELQAADAQGILSTQGLDERSKRQIDRSNSLMPGSTAMEMAGNSLKSVGVMAIAVEGGAQLGDGESALTSALSLAMTKNVGRTVLGGSDAAFTEEGIVNQANNLTIDTAKLTAVGYIGKIPGSTPLVIGALAASDAGIEAYKRYQSNDFSASNPDSVFDSAVSGAAIAGKMVSTAAGGIVYSAIPEGMFGRTAAFVAVAGTVDTAFNAAEALSRASYAGTLAKDPEAEDLLNQRTEMRTREGAYKDGLDTLAKLNGDSAPTKSTTDGPLNTSTKLPDGAGDPTASIANPTAVNGSGDARAQTNSQSSNDAAANADPVNNSDDPPPEAATKNFDATNNDESPAAL